MIVVRAGTVLPNYMSRYSKTLKEMPLICVALFILQVRQARLREPCLRFEAFDFVAQNAIARLGFKPTDRFFSYLPLSHIAERMLVEMVSLYAGGQVSFAESLQTFAQNLAETKPTIFLGVHRIWTRFQHGILAKVPQKKLDILLRVPFLPISQKERSEKASD